MITSFVLSVFGSGTEQGLVRNSNLTPGYFWIWLEKRTSNKMCLYPVSSEVAGTFLCSFPQGCCSQVACKIGERCKRPFQECRDCNHSTFFFSPSFICAEVFRLNFCGQRSHPWDLSEMVRICTVLLCKVKHPFCVKRQGLQALKCSWGIRLSSRMLYGLCSDLVKHLLSDFSWLGTLIANLPSSCLPQTPKWKVLSPTKILVSSVSSWTF